MADDKQDAREDRAYANGMLAALAMAAQGAFEAAHECAERRLDDARKILNQRR